MTEDLRRACRLALVELPDAALPEVLNLLQRVALEYRNRRPEDDPTEWPSLKLCKMYAPRTRPPLVLDFDNDYREEQ